jgi:predicted transcriptional regulator
MSLIKEKLLEKISELEYPTIQNLSNELQTNRQYVSVLLNSLKEEGIVSFSEIGNNKIWKVVENGK